MPLVEAIKQSPPTATRVQQKTKAEVNEQIRRHSEAAVARAAASPEAIERRLRELDAEWDIERVLQTNFSVVNLLSITLGALAARPWFALGGVAAWFMGEHAIQGWCPPVSVFRRLGVRTALEIARERYALKALRGDFQGISKGPAAKALQAARIRTLVD